MEVVDCLNFEESIRADIKFYQKQICPKSDLYNSKYVMKNFGDYPEQMEKLLEKVKCWITVFKFNLTEIKYIEGDMENGSSKYGW